MIQNSSLSKLKMWRSAFIVLAISLATVVPFYFSSHSEAQPSTVGTLLVANLSGPPIGGMAPAGFGRFSTYPDASRVFETGVGNVNLPGGELLGVFVNGNLIGQIRLTNLKNGSLLLSTRLGQTVPDVHEGSPIAIKDRGVVILAGAFALPPPPPPTPTAAFFAPLGGPVIGGVMPRGVAQYAEFPAARRLNVFVNHVHLPPGTRLSVGINGTAAGQITLNMLGEGGLRLDTGNGGTVPVIVDGDTATVKNGGTTILSGTFRVFTPPPPHPNRFFDGRLNGAQVVPPVTTDARGLIHVIVNPEHTQIHVLCGFMGLSSAQTTATINGPAMRGETGPAIFDLGTIGGTHGRFPVLTFDITAEQAADLRNGLWYVQIGSADNPTGEIRGQIHGRPRPSNFAGSEMEDIAVFRPANGTWYVKNDTGYSEQILGQPGDQPVSGDFDGDGQTDYSVFRNGTWLISRSSDGGLTTRQFGVAGDIPVRGDYDGDGQSDLAVFRPSTGVWYVEKSDRSGYIIMPFGINGDIPVASDIDGDGATDVAVFRPSNGVWYWIRSSKGDFGAAQFGVNGDVPITGDFDGDGADDLAVYRPSTGVWYAWRSSEGTFDIRQFGTTGDIPIAANYDSDGVADIAVFRPSTGIWYIWRSSDNTFDYQYFGVNGDIPTTKD